VKCFVSREALVQRAGRGTTPTRRLIAQTKCEGGFRGASEHDIVVQEQRLERLNKWQTTKPPNPRPSRPRG
jgi:hypothetical protein